MCEPWAADVAGLDDDGLAGLVGELEALADRVEAARLAVVGEWNARRLWAVDGAYNGAGWLAARCRRSRAEMASLVSDAGKLRTMAVTGPAVAAGGLAPAKARLLCRAVNARTRETFSRDEQLLVDTVSGLTVDEAANVIRLWARYADPDGPEPRDRDANRLWLSQTMAGRWQLKGDLDQESGTVVSGVLAGLVDAAVRAQRDAGATLAGHSARLRADALVEMAYRATAVDPATASARPLLWVIAGQEQLDSGKGVCQLAGGGPIAALSAQRLRCDCELVRVLYDPDGTPQLDLGRSRRTASASQRRALWVRDGGCRFLGCSAPPEWCEAHHLLWWEHGGTTDLANLALVCRHHHHLLHEGGWRVESHGDGHLRFYRPDGTRLEPPPIAA